MTVLYAIVGRRITPELEGDTTMTDERILLTREETAAVLRVKPQTLAVWLCRGTGPRLPVVRVHGRALYRRADIDALIAASTIGGSPEPRRRCRG